MYIRPNVTFGRSATHKVGGGGCIGLALVALLGHFGVEVSPTDASILTGAASLLFGALGKDPD